MKLLVVTQKVDREDSVLGFFHAWLVRFAKHFEVLTVVCLEEGDHDLPRNVHVRSLGKEKGLPRIKILKNFWKILFEEKDNYDTVLVHMNPIYVVLAGMYWKFLVKKDIYLWYTHKSVDWKLRIAEKFVKKIFTASRESFRLQSKKVLVMNHGIDINVFIPGHIKEEVDNLSLLTVGRVSKAKGLDVCVEALSLLEKKVPQVIYCIVGGPLTDKDIFFEKRLKDLIEDRGLREKVVFVGPISNKQSVDFFQRADFFVHASDTGSLDKVVLEAMSCGAIVISSNDAAVSILSKNNPNLIFKKNDPKDLAEKIQYFLGKGEELEVLRGALREEVVQNHNIDNLIQRVSGVILKKYE